MRKVWETTYVIGDTAKWGNAPTQSGEMPATGGKKQ